MSFSGRRLTKLVWMLAVLIAISPLNSAGAREEGFFERLKAIPGRILDSHKLGNAHASLRAGEFQRVIELSDDIITTNRLPTHQIAAAHTLRGLAYAKTSRMDEAMSDMDEAIGLAPENPEPHLHRGWLLTDTSPQEALADIDYYLASAQPPTPLARLLRGQALTRLGRFSEALRDLEIYMSVAPDNPHAYMLVSAIHNNLNDPQAALKAIDRYAELVETPQPEAHFNRGLALYHLDRLSEALEHLEIYINIAPDDPDAYVLLSALHIDLNDPRAALTALDRYTELVETPQPEAHFIRGLALYQLNRFSEALEEFSRPSVLAESALSEVWYNRGKTLRRLNRHAEALADFEHYQQLVPDSLDVQMALGFAHARLGQRDKSREHFEKIRELRPDLCCSNWMIGIIDYFEGDYPSAEEALRREVEITNLPYVPIWLSMISERRLEDPVAALEREISGRDEVSGIDPLIAALRGGSEQEAIDAVSRLTEDEEGPRFRCETYTYLAERALIRGRQEEAALWFENAVSTGSTVDECIFAQWRLDQLRDLQSPTP